MMSDDEITVFFNCLVKNLAGEVDTYQGACTLFVAVEYLHTGVVITFLPYWRNFRLKGVDYVTDENHRLFFFRSDDGYREFVELALVERGWSVEHDIASAVVFWEGDAVAD